MKTLKEKIEIMQAFGRGEQIQMRDSNIEWTDVESPEWNWINYDYRVKPESEYIPFEKPEEFLESLRKHGEGLTGINDPRIVRAHCLYINIDGEVYKSVGNRHFPATSYLYYLGDLEYLFRNCKFVDGTPCGKEVLL